MTKYRRGRVFLARLVAVTLVALALVLVWCNSDAAVRAGDRLLFLSLVRETAAEYRLPPDLVLAVIMVESSFNPGARSAAGAVGLMQVMPVTAREIAGELGYRAAEIDLRDPATNIRFGCHYLAALIRRCGSLERALLAYNGGPATLDELGAGDTHPYPETRQFVERVTCWQVRFARLLRLKDILRGETSAG